jgi:hypothetical protein
MPGNLGELLFRVKMLISEIYISDPSYMMAVALRDAAESARTCAGSGAAMMSVVRDDEGGPADGPEAFDRKVAEVLEAEAGMLSEKSERLLATGSVRIERPAGVLNASLRPPRWWRAGVFRQSAVRGDGAASSGVVPLGRTMDETFVLSEITLQLAVIVAWLDE